PFVVRDIRIEGIQRTEPGTVFSYLPVKVGDTLTEDKASEAVRALFATGFFRDVRLEVEGQVLVVYVEERPAIASVDIVGAKEFDKDTLKRVLREQGLAESRIFDRSVLERAEQELKRQYLARGRYAASVTSTITPLERNRVGIVLTVVEGDVARIGAIRFVGNKAFSDKRLLDEMRLSTPTWFTWYSKADQYSREKFAADLEALRSFYLDRGYLEFEIVSTQVSITPDREDVELTIALREGEQYRVSGVHFGGNLLGREEDLARLVTLKPGDIFSGSKLSDSTKRISERLGALGYAFANVNAVPTIDREKHEVSFEILVDPARRVYVRRISIAGNSRTRDEVIRREMRQYEDAWYDAEKIRLSRERIDRLGY
ncbi:MAG: outer membrane protein assembly factor BamA, partial [Gammaproteobacteria bacterium]